MTPRYDARTPIVAQMSALVRTAAAALILVGALAGCSRTTTGTVAMTTEPGPPTTSRTPSTTSKPTTPRSPTSTPRTATVPAPANALTMTCKEYLELDDETKLAVVQAILGEEESFLGPDEAELLKPLADGLCQLLPTSPVSEVLMGGGLPK
jgi:hypothetical protein